MQFNPGDGSGIVDEIYSLSDATTTSYPIAAVTRRANTALEDIAAALLNADGTWQWDDTNYTTNPIGTTDLVAAQSGYTFASDFIAIENVKVKDASGNWRFIKPIDQSQSDLPLENYQATTGFPEKYDKLGSTITLYPAPSSTAVTLSGGLKVQYKRTGSLFTTTDTTKQPGFASPFHILVAQKAALPYCKTYKPERVPQLARDIATNMTSMIAFYGRRQRDERSQITSKPIKFR